MLAALVASLYLPFGAIYSDSKRVLRSAASGAGLGAADGLAAMAARAG